jgi:hypothetical protein
MEHQRTSPLYSAHLQDALQVMEDTISPEQETRAFVQAAQVLISLVAGQYIGHHMGGPAFFESVTSSLNYHIQQTIVPCARWWRGFGHYARFETKDVSASGDVLRIDLGAFVGRLERVTGFALREAIPVNRPMKRRRPLNLGRLLPNPRGILDIDEIIESRRPSAIPSRIRG